MGLRGSKGVHRTRKTGPGTSASLTVPFHEQITTKSGHISDVEFEPQPPLLIDDETPNDQVRLASSRFCSGAHAWYSRARL